MAKGQVKVRRERSVPVIMRVLAMVSLVLWWWLSLQA